MVWMNSITGCGMQAHARLRNLRDLEEQCREGMRLTADISCITDMP
jgi:hypothetical protein